ncbi:MAG: hypothetical protein JXQ76_00770 [Campylobacterales bacterium]|nr:hypothetical protein [Campylobacterales bacterium]
MDILLINKNMVVSKLVERSANELNASLQEQTAIANLAKTHYDVVIIDESALTPQLESSLTQLTIGSTILLNNNPMELMQSYDFELKKPFLPRDLSSILLEITNQAPANQPNPSISANPNDLLEQILSLEPLKIKEILAGAKVNITIEFPKKGEIQ